MQLGTEIITILASGAASTIFFWIGLVVLIEGERQAPVTWALALTTIAAALFFYSQLGALLWSVWSAIHQRLFLGWTGAMLVGWYAVALFHTRTTFSAQRWPNAQASLVGLGLIWFVLTIAHSNGTPLFLPPASNTTMPSTALAWLPPTLVVGSLGGSLLVLLRAMWINRRSGREQRATEIFWWFVLPNITAVTTALLIALAAWDVFPAPAGRLTLQLSITFGILSCAALLLASITTSRKLLGRPIRKRSLLLRGAFLLLCTVALLTVELFGTSPQDRNFELMLIAVLSPMVAATLEWRQLRSYRDHVISYQRFVRSFISNNQLQDPADSSERALRIFEKLVVDLKPDACYLQIRLNPNEKPFELHHHWNSPPPNPRESKLYDLRRIDVDHQSIGYIALQGPRGIAYSELELQLAESCAYSIARLQIESRQAQLLEQMAVRVQRQSQERQELLHRVLHDEVGGNLDAILKYIGMLPDTDPQLKKEMVETIQESMTRIRSLLRSELPEPYPTDLKHGLIAALYWEWQHRSHRGATNVSIVFETNGLDDATLNSVLNEQRRRHAFSALNEAVRNAVKYAGGPNLRPVQLVIQMYLSNDHFVAEVQDNGIGFVPDLASSNDHGIGLLHQRGALRSVGGTLTVKSQPGAGAKVTIELPTKPLYVHPKQDAQTTGCAKVAYSPLDWQLTVYQIEQHTGGRLLLNQGFSDLTRPESVMCAHYQSKGYDQTTAEQLTTIDSRRQRLFAEYIQIYTFREIVDLQCVKRYIHTGAMNEESKAITLTLAHAHVNHLIWLLRHYDQYDLALYSQTFAENFAIKPEYAVLWEPRVTSQQQRLGVTEGVLDTELAIVQTYTQRFEQTWQEVVPHFRDKATVIGWLETQLVEARI